MSFPLILFIFSLLCACSSKPKPPAPSPHQPFYDSRLLFDYAEETERIECPIQGKIPDWLSGTLLRNGPGKFTVGDKRVDWFDGLALLHAFEFHHSAVFYSSRFLRSEQYHIMEKEKSLNFAGFAMDPCPKVFKDQASRFIPQEMKDIHNANVSIQQYADQFVALTEIPLPVLFDPKTLETAGLFHYQDNLEQGQWESAHPLVDPATKESFNYFVRFGRHSHYVVWKMREGRREVVAEIPVDKPAYMHSFALTERYVVLIEYPFVVSPRDLLHRTKPFIMNYKWEPDRGTHFIVIERATGKVSKIKTKPFFAFHQINAFDKEDQIIVDLVTYPNTHIIKELDGEESWQSDLADAITLKRFTLSLPGSVSEETLFDRSAELPRVPAERVSRPYRYCYLVDYDFPNTVTDKRALYKLDTTTKTAIPRAVQNCEFGPTRKLSRFSCFSEGSIELIQPSEKQLNPEALARSKSTILDGAGYISWSQEGCIPSEPIFVAKPGAIGEDDGVILSLVLDFAKQQSFLLILDAKGMKEIARAAVPHAVPLGLHGLWK